MPLHRYASLVFDCDGVVLDSNRLKTEAFGQAAAAYGPEAARAMVDHHVAHGGVSRYAKFAHFLDRIVPQVAPGRDGPGLEALLEAYAAGVREGLATCAVAEGLEALRALTPGVRWLIVSGGDQAELREVFAARGLAEMFDGGIFGSPDTKDAILARELAAGTVRRPALFVGDSRLDHEAAGRAGHDFVYVSGWSEWREGPQLAAAGAFPAVPALADLLPRAAG